MIWKIFTAILLAALIILCAILVANSAELKKIRSSLFDIESEKSSLQARITELERTQSSNQMASDTKIEELKTIIDEIGAKYPINITDIVFNNEDKDHNKLNTETHSFSKNNVQFVCPVIKFNSNLRIASRQDLYYKFFDPNGMLQYATNSPPNYTWSSGFLVYGDFYKNNTEELSGFSCGCPNCNTGSYKVEIWCKDVLIGESYFVITDY